MALFEVAVLEHPEKKKDESQKPEKLVGKPEYVIAKDGQAAALRFMRDHAAALADLDMDRVEVLVRPFA